MIRQSEKINLSSALEIFELHLDDISNALATNITANLEALPLLPTTDNDNLQWVKEEVRKLEVEEITAIPLKVIRRIQSRKYYQSVEGQQNIDKITDEDIARAKEVDIEELYDGQLRKSGSKLWGPCPFHIEKTASFCIHKENRWSCFGTCSKHGDSIDFVQKRDGVDFIQAVKALI